MPFTPIASPTSKPTPSFQPITRSSRYAEENLALAQEAERANSGGGLLKATLAGLPRAALGVGRSIVGGIAGASLAPIQAGVSALTGREAPELPELRTPIGPIRVETPQRAAQRFTQEGDSVAKASAKASVDFLLNEPFAIAPKAAILGISALAKIAPQLARTRSAQEVFDLIRKKAPDVPPETVDTLAPRIAATNNVDEVRRIVAEGVSVEKPVPISSQYIAPDELPVIEMGPRAKSNLPSIQTEPRFGKSSELTYEPVAATRATFTREAPTRVEPASIAPKLTGGQPTPIRGARTAGGAVSKVGASIEAKAVEDGLTKSFGELAEYDPITIKDQAARISEIMERDIEQAKRIVRGEEPLPEGLRAGTVIKAMEDYALMRRDSELTRQIAVSPLTAETSVFAQEMRTLAERNPDSAVALIQSVVKARQEALIRRVPGGLKKAQKSEAESIKTAIRKEAAKETWDDFITSITC